VTKTCPRPGRFTPAFLPRVAREEASRAAPFDATGTLVYYNDAAEQMLGRTYAELGPVTADEFGTMLQLADVGGTPLRRRDSPAGVAFINREPSHRTLLATTLDGRRETFECTAYPLFGKTDQMHGVLAVFWKAKS
jgi:hypothetical protein